MKRRVVVFFCTPLAFVVRVTLFLTSYVTFHPDSSARSVHSCKEQKKQNRERQFSVFGWNTLAIVSQQLALSKAKRTHQHTQHVPPSHRNMAVDREPCSLAAARSTSHLILSQYRPCILTCVCWCRVACHPSLWL